MWNLCSSSKIISERQKKRSYEIHQEKLIKMRPKMKIVPPQQPDFVYAKHKQELSRRDRLIEIDHQNEILLRKMQKIGKQQYTTNKLRPQTQNLKTLNQHIMNQQADDIYNENRRMCDKLLRVGSYYPTFEIMDKTEQLDRVRFNISQNARRVNSAANIRPQSSSTYKSKFYRTKVSRFDYQGNSTQQPVYKYYRVESATHLRPQSAPSKPKSRRPFSSTEYSARRPRKIQDNPNIEEESNRKKSDFI